VKIFLLHLILKYQRRAVTRHHRQWIIQKWVMASTGATTRAQQAAQQQTLCWFQSAWACQSLSHDLCCFNRFIFEVNPKLQRSAKAISKFRKVGNNAGVRQNAPNSAMQSTGWVIVVALRIGVAKAAELFRYSHDLSCLLCSSTPYQKHLLLSKMGFIRTDSWSTVSCALLVPAYRPHSRTRQI